MIRRRQEHPLEDTQKTPVMVTQKLERMIYWDSDQTRDVHVNLLLPSDKSRVIKEIDFRCVKVEQGQPLVYVSGWEKETTDPNVSQFAITTGNMVVHHPYDFLESTTPGDSNDTFEFYNSKTNVRKWSILKRWASVAEMCNGVRLTDDQAEVPSNAGVLGSLQRRAGSQDGDFSITRRKVVITTGPTQANGDAPAQEQTQTETVFVCPRKNYDETVQALNSLFSSPILYGDAMTLHFDSVGKTKGSMVVSVVIAIVD